MANAMNSSGSFGGSVRPSQVIPYSPHPFEISASPPSRTLGRQVNSYPRHQSLFLPQNPDLDQTLPFISLLYSISGRIFTMSTPDVSLDNPHSENSGGDGRFGGDSSSKCSVGNLAGAQGQA